MPVSWGFSEFTVELYSASLYFPVLGGKCRLVSLSLFNRHTSSPLPSSREPLKNGGSAAAVRMRPSASGVPTITCEFGGRGC